MIINSFTWSADRKLCNLAIEFDAQNLEQANFLIGLIRGVIKSDSIASPEISDDLVWIDTSRLAGLPEMPCNSQGVLRRAKREKWLMRIKPNCSVWTQVHVSNLPEITIKALFKGVL